MDARTPPIPSRHREREEERNRRSRKRDKSPEPVSLPPLTPLPDNAARQFHQRGSRNPVESGEPPCVDSHKREHRNGQRPAYRVLEIGATPLMHACQQGDRSRVLRLIKERRETLGYRDRALRSALHYCMDAGTAGAVASAAPDLVNAPDAEGHTPLHLAVIAGDAQLVAVLLANGANVNAKDSEGHGVLHWATVCGEAECARLVLAAGARPSSPDLRGGSPLHYAAQCCGAATATTRLSVPKRIGLKVLGTLLEFGADVNARDEDGRQPILWAASAGSVEAILALVRAGGSAVAGATDKDGLAALHCAASRGHANCVEALINLCGCHPDHVDDNGCSALHYAATLGHAEATALLLRLGADPNRHDRRGRTPALCAAAKGQLETLKMVAQHGGSLQARTVRGTGLAHEAVLSGRSEIIEWLAEKRPGILDLATQDGKTPLHVAALHGYLDICKVLLDHGARVNAVLRTSKNGPMTALDAALYRAHRDCAKLLQMHGGMTARNLDNRDAASPSRRPQATAVFESDRGKRNEDSSNDETSRESSADDRRSHHRVKGRYSEERRAQSRKHNRGISRESSEPRHHRNLSGSISDENIRMGKSSRRRERRSRARCCRRRRHHSHGHVDCHGRAGSQEREESSRHEYDESLSDTNERYSERERDDEEMRTGRRRSRLKKRSDSEEITATSDDSLRVVVVVRKSLERTSESVRISKTPRRREAHRRDRRVLSRERQARRRMNASETQQRASTQRVVERAGGEGSAVGRTEEKRTRVGNRDAVTDSTSQERVERVTVTALVHEDTIPARVTGRDEERDTAAASLLTSGEQCDSSSGKITGEEGGDEQRASGDDGTLRVSATVARLTLSESTPQDGNDASQTGISSERVEGVLEEDGREAAAETTNSQTNEITPNPADKDASGGGECATEEKTKAHDGPSDGSVNDITDEHRSMDLEEKSDDKTDGPPREEDSGSGENAGEDSERPGVEIPADNLENTRGDGDAKVGVTEGRKDDRQSGDRTSGDEYCSDPSAIVAVIEDPAWDDTEDESEPADAPGVPRVPASTSEEETPASSLGSKRSVAALPDLSRRVDKESGGKNPSPETPRGDGLTTSRSEKQRKDSGGRDSGIEPSPRVSKIPKRTATTTPMTMPRSYTEKQHAFDAETVTRDVQISLRRYHLERKIFFQLMELKRLQIRHGRANERVLVKRQVEAFNKTGMSGPTLGVVKYDQPLTFRHFEAFLYDQLRRLQRRSATPDSCTEAKQCTRKTHRCHHATSAYTSMPVYAYLGGGGTMGPEQEEALLPRIENQRGRGRMTVEVTSGEEKRIIALPQEQLDRTKRYYVTFTVRGEQQQQPRQQPDDNKRASSRGARREPRDARRDAQSV